MNPTLRDVECFLAFARTGHVTRAAEACRTTQSTVSKALARFERDMAVPLFDRRARAMRLNASGHAMVERAQRILAEYEGARSLAAALRAQHDSTLRVGMTGGVHNPLIGATCAALVRGRPALRIALKVDLSDALVAAVVRGDVDVAVVPVYADLPETVQTQLIGTESLVPVGRAGHPLTRRRILRLADALNYPWVLSAPGSAVRRVFEEIFRARKLAQPRIALQAEFMSDVSLGVVEATDALAMAAVSRLRERASKSVVPISISALTIPRKLMLVTRHGKPAPLIADFMEIAVGQWKGQVGR